MLHNMIQSSSVLSANVSISTDYGEHKSQTIMAFVGHYKELSTQRPGSPKNTTQQHDVSVQSTLDRRPMYYSQKQKWTRRVRMQTQ